MVCFITIEFLRSWKLSQHEYCERTGNNGSHLERDLYSALFIESVLFGVIKGHATSFLSHLKVISITEEP